MLRYITSGAEPKEILLILLLTIPTVLISLSVHEFAHGYVAYKLGDPTAKNFGRLTLNPIKHFHPIGMLSMLILGIGWANPVPINTRYFKNPKKGMAMTAAAGPISNLLLAFIGLLIYGVIVKFLGGAMPYELLLASVLFFQNFCYMNVYLAVFNMLPVPPFDGSRLAFAFLPDKYYFSIMKYENIIMMVVLIGLATGIISLPFGFISDKILSVMQWIVGLIL